MSFLPDRGGHVIPGVSMRNPAEEWEDVEPGWGQSPGIRHVQASGLFETRIVEAPVVVERIGHPNRPRPGNHGGNNS